MIACTIHEGLSDDLRWLLRQIPEFQLPVNVDEVERRTEGVPHLLLTACIDGQPVGYKLGYEREGDFYSWLGGVLPAYRRRGVATWLADYQEAWAKKAGYRRIRMKTQNCFPNMIIMAVKRGFQVVEFDARDRISDHGIVLGKSI